MHKSCFVILEKNRKLAKLALYMSKNDRETDRETSRTQRSVL